MSISAIFWKSCQDMENWKNFLMLNSCFRGQRHCRSVATRKNIHQRIRFVPICRLQKAALILAGTDYGAFTFLLNFFNTESWNPPTILIETEELLLPRLITYLFHSNSSFFSAIPDKHFRLHNSPQLDNPDQA